MNGDRLPPITIAGPAGPDEPAPTGRETDPRALRVGVAPASRLEGDRPISIVPALVVSSPPAASAPAVSLPAGSAPASPFLATPAVAAAMVGSPVDSGVAAPEVDELLVDGVPTHAILRRFDATRARLEWRADGTERRTDVLLGAVERDRARGSAIREVVADGWRVVVELEPERRALLRERARRGAGAMAPGGPVEVRAIIPGRVVAVSVAPGDDVAAGQQVLVVEAMKMQNELRAPREGSVVRVGVAVGDTIDVGDLLVVIH